MGIWDEALKEDTTRENEYPTLPEGTYSFEVVKVDGKEYTPTLGSKIGKCAEIDLRLRVESEDKEVIIFDRLYSDPKTLWKMTAFAKCIGIFKPGMTPGMVLKNCIGCVGKASVVLRPATTQYAARNEIKSYLPPAEVPAYNPTEAKDLPF